MAKLFLVMRSGQVYLVREGVKNIRSGGFDCCCQFEGGYMSYKGFLGGVRVSLKYGRTLTTYGQASQDMTKLFSIMPKYGIPRYAKIGTRYIRCRVAK